jgi:hypothetical protein
MPPDFVGPDGARSANPANVVDYAPLMRAVLENLDRWVTEGTEPPPSSFPHIENGTSASRGEVLEVFRRIHGIAVPRVDRTPSMPSVDVGPDAERGVGRFPAKLAGPFLTYVPAVDPDGNELAGIRHPDLAVPVGSYTGWNPRDPATGGIRQIISMQGSSFPFPATEADRARRSDPRPAILARYAGVEDYLTRIRSAAEALVAQRYLLLEDVSVILEAARERYEAYTGVEQAEAFAEAAPSEPS